MPQSATKLHELSSVPLMMRENTLWENVLFEGVEYVFSFYIKQEGKREEYLGACFKALYSEMLCMYRRPRENITRRRRRRFFPRHGGGGEKCMALNELSVRSRSECLAPPTNKTSILSSQDSSCMEPPCTRM